MIKPLLLALCLVALPLASGVANDVTFSGNTTGAPTFNRPTETGARSSVGTAVPYFVYSINVITGGLFSFSLDAVNVATYDTFLHLFSGSFNPNDASDPALNFLAGNDDRSLTTTNSGFAFTLVSGRQYSLVLDGFLNSDFGAYIANISSNSGVFTAAAVPDEGSTLVLSGIALGTLALASLRFRGQPA